VVAHHLARVLDHALVVDERRLLGAIEEVRVVGALAQLHEDVEHARLVVPHRVEHVDVLRQDVAVPRALHLGHADQQLDLLLRWQVLLDVSLEPAEEERAKDAVQLRGAPVMSTAATRAA